MSVGAVVPVTFTVQDQGLLRTISQIERASQGAAKSIAGIGDTAKLGALSKRLQGVSEDLASYKRGIEEVVEQNFIWGASGTALVNEIENVRDPLKRLELGQKALAGVTSTTGKALGSVTQGLATAKAEAAIWAGGVENLALLTGGLGLAVGALTVGIGALGGVLLKVASGGLQAYIAGTKDAAKVQADFEATTSRAEKRLGELLYKTLEYDKVTRGAEVGVAGLERKINDLNDGQGLLNQTIAAAGLVFPGYSPLLHQIALGLNEVEAATKDTDYSTRILTDSVTSQRNEYNLLAASLQGVAQSLDDVAQSAQRATPYLTGLEAGEATGASQSRAGLRRRGGGGGGGRRFQTFGGAAGAVTGAAGQFGGVGATQSAGQAGLALSGGGGATLGFGPEGTVEGDALIGFLGLEKVVSGQRGAGGRERTKQQAAANVADQLAEINRATEGYKTLGLAIDGAANAGLGLAGAFASVASGIAAGEVAAKDFGKAIRASAGALFQDLGKGFVLQGVARTASGDLFGGPALIGAGIALSIFGGSLARSGGGGGGQTRASGSAGAVAAATRASPALQRERDHERPIVLRVGERDIRGVLTDYNQDAQRRGAGGRTR